MLANKHKSTRRRKRVTTEAAEKENVNTEGRMEIRTSTEEMAGREENTSTESTGMKGEEKPDEQGELMVSAADAGGSIEDSPSSTDMQESGVKRKTEAAADPGPSKRTKAVSGGFCLYVGNLNDSRTSEVVKEALGNYLMEQSLLFQAVRLDRSRKHAYVDLASQLDLTRALALNGEELLHKPMVIDKAKVRTAQKVKVKPPAEDRRAAKNARCLFLKNVPYEATKEDILKLFSSATDVRFPGGAEGPDQGIAFVEFGSQAVAQEVQKDQRDARIQGRVLIVDFVGEANGARVTKGPEERRAPAPAPPSNTLFVGNLSYSVREEHLRNVFQSAVKVSMPQSKGGARRFAFVEFATIEDAEKALKASQQLKMHQRQLRVQFGQERHRAADLPTTLIVMDLAEQTSAETLRAAFQGALSARVIADRRTGLSKRFGFVEFDSVESCKAAKDAMEDCEIDGSRVTVAYAKSRVLNAPQDTGGVLTQCPAADQTAVKGRRSKAGKRLKAVQTAGNKE